MSAQKLGGGTLTLRSDLGRIVILNFWSSWCGYCRSEAPNLSTYAWNQRNRGVDVVGVVFNDPVSAAMSYGDGDNSHLTDEQRQMVEERHRERQEQRGGLLGVVEVYVYERGCHPQVNFPHGSLLDVETDASVISEIVARASAELANWNSVTD